MASVVTRINEIKQPRGGYIKPSQFEEIVINDNLTLQEENIHPSLVGLVVDYLTRLVMGAKVEDAFKIPMLGYRNRALVFGTQKDRQDKVDIHSLCEKIEGLDDESIISACKACSYDIWYRNPMAAPLAKKANEINPDSNTIQNVRIMVNRSQKFWEEYGPVLVSGFTFEKNGYTKKVNSGDGDYLTKDTMWDFKVSKRKLTNKHTLQLLMYWIMGKHSEKAEFKDINKLGVFNPRLNLVWLLNVTDIPKELIEKVEKEVICY